MGVTAAELIARVEADTGPADRALRGWVSGLGKGGGPLSGMAQIAGGVLGGNLLTSGLSAAGRGLADLAKLGVGAFTGMASSGMDFQRTMDGINAVIGATAAQQEGLKDLVLDLGADAQLKVSLDEAAAIVKNLGTAGVAYEEIMQGAARSTVLLANATGGDFGQSATVVTDAMTLFNIKGEDMAATIDNIAAVANVSKFDLADYAGALAQSGGVAALSGVDLDDYNTTLSATASYFNSGSDAGTSFKTFLQRLQPTTKEAAELMGELGLLTAEGTSIFYDSTGALQDMQEVAGIMSDTFGDMTEAQSSFYLGQIFGTDAMRFAAAMAGTTREEYAALQAQMGDVSALEMAATATDNAASAWEAFGEAVKTARIRFWEDSGLEGLSQRIAQGLSGLVGAAQPYLDAWATQFAGWADAQIVAIETKAAGMGVAFNEGFAASQAAGDPLNLSWAEGIDAAVDSLGMAENAITKMADRLPGAVEKFNQAGGGLQAGFLATVEVLAGPDSGVLKAATNLTELEQALDSFEAAGTAQGDRAYMFSGLVGGIGTLTGAMSTFDEAAGTFKTAWENLAFTFSKEGLQQIDIGEVTFEVSGGKWVGPDGSPAAQWLFRDFQRHAQDTAKNVLVDLEVGSKAMAGFLDTAAADFGRAWSEGLDAFIFDWKVAIAELTGAPIDLSIEVSKEELAASVRAAQEFTLDPMLIKVVPEFDNAAIKAKAAFGTPIEVPVVPKFDDKMISSGAGFGGVKVPVVPTLGPDSLAEMQAKIAATPADIKVGMQMGPDSFAEMQTKIQNLGAHLPITFGEPPPITVDATAEWGTTWTQAYHTNAGITGHWDDSFTRTHLTGANITGNWDDSFTRQHFTDATIRGNWGDTWSKVYSVVVNLIPNWLGGGPSAAPGVAVPGLNSNQAYSDRNEYGRYPKNYAVGTDFHPGGLAWVGEEGRELVRLPRGSRVYTHEESERMAGGNKIINIYPQLNTPADQEMLMHKLRRLLRD